MILAKTKNLRALVDGERRRQGRALALASLSAAVLSVASVALLSLSGWFIAAAALAGAAGLASAQMFNYLIPAAAVRFLAILRTGFRYAERVASHEAALKALARIRPALFAGLAAAPPKEALALSGGEASARLVQDVDAIETLFARLSNPWAAGAAVASGVALTGLAGWAPALALAAFCVIATFNARHLAPSHARLGRDQQRAAGALKDAVAAFAAAAPELRCYGLETWAADEIDARGRAFGALKLQSARAQGWSSLAQSAILGLAIATVVALAARASTSLAALAGLATVGTLEILAGVLKAMEQNGAVAEAADRLEPLLVHGAAQGVLAGSWAEPAIAFDGQLFAPGERIAIAGPSGAGKTTLFERLLVLRAPPAGFVQIDGVDLAALSAAEARRCFAYAPQDAALLAGTVRENLALADPQADDDALWAVLHDAALDIRVQQAPEGLDSWVGENGARLSGGERRRLCLARALLRPAPWLILDEPTEGLDEATETLVLNRLQQRLDRTGQGLLIASHRAAPLRLCSRLVQFGGSDAAQTPARSARV